MKLLFIPCYAQTIQMEDIGGVYKIPCIVNGLRLKMIFDPGAARVSISYTVAKMMMENDYLSPDDIMGTEQSQVADGSIVDNLLINLREVKIGDLVLNNVNAWVSYEQDAPLLFGQSALRKLGRYTISGNKLIIGSSLPLTENEIESIDSIASSAFYNGFYSLAVEQYGILYDNELLTTWGKRLYALSLEANGNIEESLIVYKSIEKDIIKNYPEIRADLCLSIGLCYYKSREYVQAIPYFEKSMFYESNKWNYTYYESAVSIVDAYKELGYYGKSIDALEQFINDYLQEKQFNPTDCWTKKIRDKILGSLYERRSYANSDYFQDEWKKYIIIAACWGDEYAINRCRDENIDFTKKPLNYNY